MHNSRPINRFQKPAVKSSIWLQHIRFLSGFKMICDLLHYIWIHFFNVARDFSLSQRKRCMKNSRVKSCNKQRRAGRPSSRPASSARTRRASSPPPPSPARRPSREKTRRRSGSAAPAGGLSVARKKLEKMLATNALLDPHLIA